MIQNGCVVSDAISGGFMAADMVDSFQGHWIGTNTHMSQ